MKKYFCIPIMLVFAFAFQTAVLLDAQTPGRQDYSRILLPNGWSLKPAGISLPLQTLPMNIIVNEPGMRAIVTHAGMGPQNLTLIDLVKHEIIYEKEMHSLWYGLTYIDRGSKFAASAGNDNSIYLCRVFEDSIIVDDTLRLGKPYPKNVISPAGLDVDDTNRLLFVATKGDSSLYICNFESKSTVRKVNLGSECFGCAYYRPANSVFVSVWGNKEVVEVSAETGAILHRIPVGDHPSEIKLGRRGDRLFVTNSNENTVSVIDAVSRTVSEVLTTSILPGLPPGSTPNGLAFVHEDSLLAVTNADNNCIALFDITKPGQSRPLGFIPTGWYPTAVTWFVNRTGSQFAVLNGKGNSSRPNPDGPNPTDTSKSRRKNHIGRILTGSVSFIPLPWRRDLAEMSKTVYENCPISNLNKKLGSGNNRMLSPDSPIKYLLYIIKENRTYDQVFGDMKEGNGDSSLCLFPDSITPNHHALAKQFALFDNFYCNAEVSADGHNWSMGAYASDYVAKTWPTQYSGRGGEYDFEGGVPIVLPLHGYLWNQCKRYGVSYFDFGEFVDYSEAWKAGDKVLPAKAVRDVLTGHLSERFPGFNMNVSDVDRAKIWIAEFDSMLAGGTLPRLQTMHLPNDHTVGTQINMPTPRAYVADNDRALGMIIEHLSKSQIWDSCAVFVIEDDAQDGPDHVDAHRTVALVISPWIKPGTVDHTLYSTSSMIRTMELILGLPPLTQYDSLATPILTPFVDSINRGEYKALSSKVTLEERNTKNSFGSAESGTFDFRYPDRVPDEALSRIVWGSVFGSTRPMPAPVRGGFVTGHQQPDETDSDGD